MRVPQNVVAILAALIVCGVADPAKATGVKNGDFELDKAWKWKKKAGYSGMCGRTGRGGRVGRNILGKNGNPEGRGSQTFSCRPTPPHDNWFCVITFWAKYTPGVGPHAGEKARVGIAHKGKAPALKQTKIIPGQDPAAWTEHKIWLQGCKRGMRFVFDVIDDPAGAGQGKIGSTLCIDDVTCECLETKPDGSGGLTAPGDGESYSNDDYASLQGPCTKSGMVDCNGNGVQDVDDIAEGESADTDGNDIPDECETGATGRCCHCDGSCEDDVTEAVCNAADGVYGGNSSTCSGVECTPTPIGACVSPDGEMCVYDLPELLCDEDEWLYLGDDTLCGGGGGVPTVSEWSLIIMTVLAFTAGTVLFGRRRRAAAA